MQKVIENYLARKKASEHKDMIYELNEIMSKEGSLEREYCPDPAAESEEYPMRDEKGSFRYKKIEYLSDEEYDALKKYSDKMPSGNGISALLTIIAVLDFISGFILGLTYSYTFSSMLTYWAVGFVTGSMLLGFVKIIKLLQQIADRG